MNDQIIGKKSCQFCEGTGIFNEANGPHAVEPVVCQCVSEEFVQTQEDAYRVAQGMV